MRVGTRVSECLETRQGMGTGPSLGRRFQKEINLVLIRRLQGGAGVWKTLGCCRETNHNGNLHKKS